MTNIYEQDGLLFWEKTNGFNLVKLTDEDWKIGRRFTETILTAKEYDRLIGIECALLVDASYPQYSTHIELQEAQEVMHDLQEMIELVNPVDLCQEDLVLYARITTAMSLLYDVISSEHI